MKPFFAACVFASSLTLALSAGAEEPPKAPAAAKEKAARPAPSQARARRAKPSLWIAADPHVPLALVDGKLIRSVGKRGKECGPANRWAKPKTRWKAVDAWGQVTGSFEIAGSELFDVTGCREIMFQALSRKEKEGAGLFVSESSSWRPSPSVAWKPSDKEMHRFERFAAALEELYVNEAPFGKAVPLAKRAMFFEVKPPAPVVKETREAKVNERSIGKAAKASNKASEKPAQDAMKRPARWAVLGGPILVVAYLGENGHWKVSEVKKPLGLTDSYKPIAIFDLNGDGTPEIMYSTNDGPTYGDNVLSLDPSKLVWGDAAESPGGATL